MSDSQPSLASPASRCLKTPWRARSELLPLANQVWFSLSLSRFATVQEIFAVVRVVVGAWERVVGGGGWERRRGPGSGGGDGRRLGVVALNIEGRMEELFVAILSMLLVVALIPLYLWKRRQDSPSPDETEEDVQVRQRETVIRATGTRRMRRRPAFLLPAPLQPH
ncbi:hypothetical protein Acr_23g0008660 [Actinidia rufa]|uniref:Uncharacterized protein n=1 Tax=Actinidia rufa TaxID=165716 RepID=A0A7J0GNX7_9ERIC|nr:hypothetical protein Acr_23g0008660 [Actinidia rufa]